MIRVPTGNLRYAGELCASVVSALGGALLLADLPGGINLVRAMSRSLQPSLQSARLIARREVRYRRVIEGQVRCR